MKQPVLVANWKMNKTVPEALEYGRRLRDWISDRKGPELILAPSYISLGPLAEVLAGSGVGLAAQNVHWEDKGPFTGEVSPLQILDAGCRYVIIGHSERRQHFGEGYEQINRKVLAVLRHGLRPLVCVGETLQERESGSTLKVLDSQISRGLEGLADSAFDSLLVAYEPVWAIGTGRAVTVEQAAEAHGFIREKVETLFGEKAGKSLRILYGGSINRGNAASLIAEPQVDGLLVGGASLDFQEFSDIFLSLTARSS